MNLWLIPLLPLAGALLNGLFGRRFSKRTVATIGLAFPGAAMVWTWIAAVRFFAAGGAPLIERYAPWLAAGNFVINYSLYLDRLSLLMVLVVTGVGFLIHVYSVGYMAEEGGYYRFFSYLNLFMFFMLTLVLANNYLLMFVGWEGVGLASYLLIGFFFLRDSASAAGKKAFIVNRIGDFGFLIALFLLIKNFGTLEFAGVFQQASAMPSEASAGLLTTIGLLLLLGACGKSAQLPLYVWLPDAMEGPTPVSALIHAATMVTAGVYMIARSHAVFDRAPIALTVVAIIGCATALFAATIGTVQHDIKRVLAYSTISQLGYMVLACGVAAYSAAMFHLMTHAFFKALLFLAAGSVIHALGGEQDMRRMGGLRHHIPGTFWTMTVATFAIAGIFPLSGFFSKDEILYRSWASPFGSWGFWAVGVFSAFLTAFYMFRLWFLTFFGELRWDAKKVAPAAHAPDRGRSEVDVSVPEQYVAEVLKELKRRGARIPSVEPHGDGKTIKALLPVTKMMYLEAELRGMTDDKASITVHHPEEERPGQERHAHEGHIHESPRVMLIPLIILAVLSFAGGWIGWPQVLGGSNHFEHFLAPVFEEHATTAEVAATNPAEGHAPSEIALTLAATGAALLGIGLAWLLYYKRREWPAQLRERFHGIYTTLENKYYVDEIYAWLFVKPIVEGSRYVLWRVIDAGLIDGTVNDSAEAARQVSDGFRHMQSGNIRSYAGWVALGGAAVLAYMVWLGVR
ncbi:MAG: NADH-quinone oxidoreductase subunit L [Terriglobales bacterium]